MSCCGSCCQCNATTAMNGEGVLMQVVPCHSENACGMNPDGSMSSMYVFGVLIVIGLALQVLLQAKTLHALRKLKK